MVLCCTWLHVSFLLFFCKSCYWIFRSYIYIYICFHVYFSPSLSCTLRNGALLTKDVFFAFVVPSFVGDTARDCQRLRTAAGCEDGGSPRGLAAWVHAKGLVPYRVVDYALCLPVWVFVGPAQANTVRDWGRYGCRLLMEATSIAIRRCAMKCFYHYGQVVPHIFFLPCLNSLPPSLFPFLSTDLMPNRVE